MWAANGGYSFGAIEACSIITVASMVNAKAKRLQLLPGRMLKILGLGPELATAVSTIPASGTKM